MRFFHCGANPFTIAYLLRPLLKTTTTIQQQQKSKINNKNSSNKNRKSKQNKQQQKLKGGDKKYPSTIFMFYNVKSPLNKNKGLSHA